MSTDATADLIRRMVDGFSQDVEAIQAGVVDGRVPERARLVLAAALTYVVEPVDLVPDRLQGLGMIDDAAILRLAAHAAVGAGAADPALRRLAAESNELYRVFDDLLPALVQHLDNLTRPDANGRTPAHVIANGESRTQLWKEADQRRESYRPHALVALAIDAAELVKTLREILRARLGRPAKS